MHDRAFFDLGRLLRRSGKDLARHLLDHQLDAGPMALVAQDPTSLRPTRASRISARVNNDEGASCFWLTPQA